MIVGVFPAVDVFPVVWDVPNSKAPAGPYPRSLEQTKRPVVVLVDHSERLLHEQGAIAPYWERFLSRFLRGQHSSLLMLATNQWPEWFGCEHLFISEVALPPLTQEKAALLLQQLGLETVPVPLLQEVYQKVGGIPLCLEWVAALVKQLLQAEDWEEFDAREDYGSLFSRAQGQDLIRAVSWRGDRDRATRSGLSTYPWLYY